MSMLCDFCAFSVKRYFAGKEIKDHDIFIAKFFLLFATIVLPRSSFLKVLPKALQMRSTLTARLKGYTVLEKRRFWLLGVSLLY